MISVIIPVWNKAASLRRSLLSLEKQTYRDFDTDRQLMDDGLVDEAFVLEEYFGSSVYSMFDGVVHTSLNQDFGHETQRH
jgi:glycosyltransferase involved in cell wall biosynthesis